MILIISTCKEKLHELEFVKPIEKILKKLKKKYIVKNYLENFQELDKFEKIIICGTSLKDFDYVNHLGNFAGLKDFEKPVLGICAGAQIIGLNFRAKIKYKTEIGFYKENFKKEFLGLKGKKEVYHLHNNYITLPKDFIKFTTSRIPQAIKHKSKNIFGILFHPEVRNKKLIENFIKL